MATVVNSGVWKMPIDTKATSAMAMPIGSLIAKFRDEFEAEIEANRNERERKLAAEFAAAEVEIEGVSA